MVAIFQSSSFPWGNHQLVVKCELNFIRHYEIRNHSQNIPCVMSVTNWLDIVATCVQLDAVNAYDSIVAMETNCAWSNDPPIPRHIIVTPELLRLAAADVTSSVEVPAIITIRILVASDRELANRLDWQVERAVPAAQAPPTFLTESMA